MIFLGKGSYLKFLMMNDIGKEFREKDEDVIEVKFMSRQKQIPYKKGMRVKDVIKALSLTPDTCIVVKNGEVTTEDEEISPKDEIKVIPAISGGV